MGDFLNKVFSKVAKDSNGFEDIDKFWTASEKLNYPLPKTVESHLERLQEKFVHYFAGTGLRSTEGNYNANDTEGSSDEEDFNYNDTGSITDYSSESSERSRDQTAGDGNDSDEDTVRQDLNATNITIPLTPLGDDDRSAAFKRRSSSSRSRVSATSTLGSEDPFPDDNTSHSLPFSDTSVSVSTVSSRMSKSTTGRSSRGSAAADSSYQADRSAYHDDDDDVDTTFTAAAASSTPVPKPTNSKTNEKNTRHSTASSLGLNDSSVTLHPNSSLEVSHTRTKREKHNASRRDTIESMRSYLSDSTSPASATSSAADTDTAAAADETMDTHNTSVPDSDRSHATTVYSESEKEEEKEEVSTENDEDEEVEQSSMAQSSVHTSVNTTHTTPKSRRSSTSAASPSTVGLSTDGSLNLSDASNANTSILLGSGSGLKTPNSRRVTFDQNLNLSPISHTGGDLGDLASVSGSGDKKRQGRGVSIGSIGDASTVASTSVAAAESDDGGFAGGDYGGNDDDDGGDDGYGYGYGDDDGNDHDHKDVVNNNGDDSDDVDPRMASMVSSNTNTPVKGGMVGGVKGRTSAPLYGSGRSSTGSSGGVDSSPSGRRGRGRRTSLDSNAEVLVDLDKTPKGFKSMKGGYKGTLLTDGTFVADEEEEDTDREEDGSMAANTTGISTDSEGRDPANDTTFVADNSFLFQISERNPKYVGNKKRPRNKLHDSDSEEEYNNLAAAEVSSESGAESDATEDGMKVRRSRRATKGKKFQFWKGERPLYDQGTMIGVATAAPTPKKKRHVNVVTGKKGKGKRLLPSSSDEEDEEEAGGGDRKHVKPQKLRKIQLPEDVQFINRKDYDHVATWNDRLEQVEAVPVICKIESITPKPLPSSDGRRDSDLSGLAAQTMSGPEMKYSRPDDPNVVTCSSAWVSGLIHLPAQAVKDVSKVGKFNQIFVLAECQDGAVELALAHPDEEAYNPDIAQRMLLKKGDTFHVPPGNIYRLENHSSDVTAVLYWTIIKPVEVTVDELTAAAEAAVGGGDDDDVDVPEYVGEEQQEEEQEEGTEEDEYENDYNEHGHHQHQQKYQHQSAVRA